MIELSRGVDSHLTAGDKGLCLDQAVFFYVWSANDDMIIVQVEFLAEQFGDMEEVGIMLQFAVQCLMGVEKICWSANINPQPVMQECSNGIVLVERVLPSAVNVGEFVRDNQLQELGT